MKKLLIVILSLIACACLAVGFVGCGHTHTYSNEWTFDETYHWHIATCEHKDEVSAKAEHSFVDGKCSVCGANESDKRATVAKIDVEKVIKGLINNAYTVNATAGDETIEISQSFKDLFVKIRMGDEKALVDKTGIYFTDKDELHYASIKAVANEIVFNITHMPLDSVIEQINAYLPEGWTFDDVVAIVWDGEEFKFDMAKATSLLEAMLFNEGITVSKVIGMAQDGITYAEIEEILKPEIIALINNALPEGMTLETVMPMLANITPAKVKAIFDAFCAGELNTELINAILPEGITVEFVNNIIAMFYPELNITVEDVIEKINAVVKYINSIDFDAIEKAIKEAQIKAINAILDVFFIEEKVDAGVKYTLNYGVIKDANTYLNETTLETIINTVMGKGFVDKASDFSVYLLDSQLSELKAMLEGYIGMTLEEALDKIDEYAEEYAPIVNKIIAEMIIGDTTGMISVDVLPAIKGATAMAREKLADEEFMAKTLGETIELFAGEQGITTETIKNEITKAVNYLKTNTVYDVLASFGMIDKEGLYNKINEIADMLTANFPVYFVINADGELEELSINAVIISEDDDDNKNISILIKKGDLLGDIFTAEEKAEIMSAPTKYTVADFTGYQYAYYHEYVSGGYQSNEVKVIVTVEENEGTYTINRLYKYGNYYSEKYSYYFEDADLSDAIITINEDGTIRYDIVRYCYIMESNNSGESGYMEYEEISLVFGENISWLTKDKNYVNDFVALPDAEEVA